jgi:hypothetical protein
MISKKEWREKKILEGLWVKGEIVTKLGVMRGDDASRIEVKV